MRDFLTHQAGLTPFIPFWKETIKANGKFKQKIRLIIISQKNIHWKLHRAYT